jgi:valyl-tRNA synthetase
MNVPPSAKAALVMVGANQATEARLQRHDPAIKRLARVTEIRLETAVPSGSARSWWAKRQPAFRSVI